MPADAPVSPDAPPIAAARPVLRLRPNADARRIRFGHPWVGAAELVLDRRARALPPGTVAQLQDADRRPLATVAVAPGARVAARVLDADPDAAIDEPWLAGRLARAVRAREALGLGTFHRLVHAEADGLPGLIVDRYGDAAVAQLNAAWIDARAPALARALAEVAGLGLVLRGDGARARAQEGLPEGGVTRMLGPEDHPALRAPVAVPMNGATYLADLVGGQKTGLFYDQRPNHAFVASLSRGRDVLDVFSHVGGFALAALAAGAAGATCVDGSAAALALAERGAAASDAAGRLSVRQGDAFDAMAALAAEGRRFDVVVADPPAFAPARAARDAGLRAYERVARLAAALVAPGGALTLCSCSHAADLAAFRAASLRGVGRAGRAAQILRTGFAGPDHPVHPDLGETGYLKALTLRLLN